MKLQTALNGEEALRVILKKENLINESAKDPKDNEQHEEEEKSNIQRYNQLTFHRNGTVLPNVETLNQEFQEDQDEQNQNINAQLE